VVRRAAAKPLSATLPGLRPRAGFPQAHPSAGSGHRAELKNTVCIAKGDKAFISQHIGDLENLATYEFFQKTVAHMQRILNVRPEVIACDCIRITQHALGDEQEAVPKVRVQHHHAHIVSAWRAPLEGAVIGVACDGTGYGLTARCGEGSPGGGRRRLRAGGPPGLCSDAGQRGRH